MKYLKLFGSAFVVGFCVSACYDFVKWFSEKRYCEGQRDMLITMIKQYESEDLLDKKDATELLSKINKIKES